MKEKKKTHNSSENQINEPQKAEKLFEQLEQNLLDIETEEIMNGMTPEELEEKGFGNSKAIHIERSKHKTCTEKEKLMFQEGVDFKRCADNEKFDSIAIADLIHLNDVKEGQCIALRNSNESITFGPGNNVRKEIKEECEYYYAEKKGKVIIIGKGLHVVPSDIDCTIEIKITHDAMRAFLTCSPAYGSGVPLSDALVKTQLHNKGIVSWLDEKAIKQTVALANDTCLRQENVLVAQAQKPVNGEDGRIRFSFDTTQEEYGFTILPDGRVDYRNIKTIKIARKGDLLAQKIPAQKGVPGVNLFGDPVPARTGKEAVLIAGKGVYTKDNDMLYYADNNGQIVLNGPILEVLNVYVVNGDVDYSTGNINFNGNVLVKGMVTEGFRIKTDGDIIVIKSVESAHLEAGRDIIVKGGVQGRGKGTLCAGRDITVEFVQNSTLEAQGNIYIEKFAINTVMYTSKFLFMQRNHGSVIGGEVHAQRGIDVRVLGSVNETKTFIEAGTDYLIKRKIDELDKNIDFCQKNIKKIEAVLSPLVKVLKDNPAALQSKTILIKKSLEKKKELEKYAQTMQAKKTALYEEIEEKKPCFIKVNHTCYPGVHVKMKGYQKKTKDALNHIMFYEDKKSGEIKTSSY